MTRDRDQTQPQDAAVSGLSRSDPRGPGITRVPGSAGFSYTDPAGMPVTDPGPLARIAAFALGSH